MTSRSRCVNKARGLVSWAPMIRRGFGGASVVGGGAHATAVSIAESTGAAPACAWTGAAITHASIAAIEMRPLRMLFLPLRLLALGLRLQLGDALVRVLQVLALLELLEESF